MALLGLDQILLQASGFLSLLSELSLMLRRESLLFA
jgi:hypothetical protein